MESPGKRSDDKRIEVAIDAPAVKPEKARLLILLGCAMLIAGCMLVTFASIDYLRERCCFLLCESAAASGNHELARSIFKFRRQGNLSANYINYVGYFTAMGKVRMLNGHCDDALKYCDDALTFVPYYPPDKANHSAGWAYHMRSLVHRKMGEYSKAIADQTEAVVLRSDCPDELCNRAACYYLNHQYLDALRDLNDFLRIGDDSGALAFRAQVYDALGDHRQAEVDRDHARRSPRIELADLP